MQRQATLVLAIALVGAAAIAGAVGLALAQEEPTPDGNETGSSSPTPVAQHEDPRNASGEGDPAQLSAWLSSHLSGQLEDGMVELSQGEYDSVESLVGDEFESRLSQYVDVAGETNAEGDDAAAESMRATAENQSEFGEDVQRYRERLEAYQEARNNGDAAAARQHARELVDLAEDIENTGGDLRSGYQSIANATDRNLEEGIDAVDTVVTNVSDTKRDVREDTFVETSLSVTTNRSVAAFDRPATVEGVLLAENGSALADHPVTLIVGNRTMTVRTDGMGQFAAVYRPVGISTDVDAVPVAFRPRSDSAYLASTTNLSLSIESVEPTVSIESAPETTAFGDEVPVEATVRVDGRPVPGVATTLAVDERILAQSNASSSGRLLASPSLPADVPAGQRSLRVTAGEEGTALSPATAGTSLQVAETATNLTVNASVVEGDLAIGGRLVTTEGVAVTNQSVTIEVGGASETVRTNATGAYATALDGERFAGAGREGRVVATFDGDGTNLAGATASMPVQLPAGPGEGAESGSLLADVPWPAVGLAVGALAVLLGVFLLVRRFSPSPGEPDVEPSTVEEREQSSSTPNDADRWIDAARDALARGDERGAIARAYAASYARLQERSAVGDDRTPRELLAEAESRVDESVLEALATVTGAYEQVAFAGRQPGGAHEVVEQAGVVVEGATSPPASDDD